MTVLDVPVDIDPTGSQDVTQQLIDFIAAAGNSGSSTTFNTTTIADGSYLTVDIDQVGTGTTGSDLTVTVWMKG